MVIKLINRALLADAIGLKWANFLTVTDLDQSETAFCYTVEWI